VSVFFLYFFCGGIVSCFSAETTVGANVGGVRKSDGIPEHRVLERAHVGKNERGDKRNPWKSVSTSKVVNPFTCALEPPVIGRRRDFYIPRIPSNLKNILNVNMYMNVLDIPWFVGLISHIYKPGTYSHLKPGLLAPPLWLSPFVASASYPWRLPVVEIPNSNHRS
jgi:hypothetical protein